MAKLAVDIGGTFTDVVCLHDGCLYHSKVPSTPKDLILGVIEGTKKVLGLAGCGSEEVTRFVHGTTIATNAVLERKGCTVGLLTTGGFEDVLEIGRMKRSQMYNLFMHAEEPVFLAPRRRRVGIPERVDTQGRVLLPLDEGAVKEAVGRLAETYAVEAVAVCYLHSYQNPHHELRTKSLIQEAFPGLFVSLSSEVNPLFREYERLCVTLFDAYVGPLVGRYLARLLDALQGIGVACPVQIMQSRGAITQARLAGDRPVVTLLSGPAAGVMGGLYAGKTSGFSSLVTLDMGGTSNDVALVPGGTPVRSLEGSIGGYPLRTPMVDVSTIGAGGGSIAWIDVGGGLRVGPQSAGALPGPACYGLGGSQATVTDADLVLGYLNSENFAGGLLRLNTKEAWRALGAISAQLGMDTPRAAYGVHQVVASNIADQVRLVSLRRGYDPRRFALVVMGGAGPVVGPLVAKDLGMPHVVVPPVPGVLSAFGLLVSDIEHETMRTVMLRLDQLEVDKLAHLYREVEQAGWERMAEEGVPLADVNVRYSADIRYVGQSFELEVLVSWPLSPDSCSRMAEDFHSRHRQVYGHGRTGEAEIVNLRVVHSYRVSPPPVEIFQAGHQGAPPPTAVRRQAYFPECGGFMPVSVWQRQELPRSFSLAGPAIVEQQDCTTVVYPGQRLWVDDVGNLVIEAV